RRSECEKQPSREESGGGTAILERSKSTQGHAVLGTTERMDGLVNRIDRPAELETGSEQTIPLSARHHSHVGTRHRSEQMSAQQCERRAARHGARRQSPVAALLQRNQRVA